MKTTFVYSLAFALAVSLATTGCRHKPVNVTPMPRGMTPPPVSDVQPPILPYSPPVNPEGNPTSDPLPAQDAEGMYGMVPDRAALAAYTIHFAYDSSVIRKSEQASLQSVAQALEHRSEHEAAHRGQLRRARHRGIQPLRSANAARWRRARRWPNWALTRHASSPAATARTSRWTPATTKPRGQKNRRDDFVLLHPKPEFRGAGRHGRLDKSCPRLKWQRPRAIAAFVLGLYYFRSGRKLSEVR